MVGTSAGDGGSGFGAFARGRYAIRAGFVAIQSSPHGRRERTAGDRANLADCRRSDRLADVNDALRLNAVVVIGNLVPLDGRAAIAALAASSRGAAGTRRARHTLGTVDAAVSGSGALSR